MAARVREIQEQGVAHATEAVHTAASFTTDRLLGYTEEIRLAVQESRPTDALKAIELLAKLAGRLTERKEVTVQHKFEQLSDEQLRSRIVGFYLKPAGRALLRQAGYQVVPLAPAASLEAEAGIVEVEVLDSAPSP